MSLKSEMQSTGTDVCGLQPKMSWREGFLLAIGGPVLVMTAIGPIAAATGSASIIAWVVTVIIGVIQTIIYADYTLMYPEKCGGFAVCATEVYKKYFPKRTLIGPIISWGYWLGWSPVLSINLLIIGMYLQKLLLPGYSPILIGGILMAIQGILALYGVKTGAKTQLLLGLFAVVPLLALGIVPFFTGQINYANVVPFRPVSGSWLSLGFIVLFLGNSFSAAWCDYATETAAVYTAEYKNPAKDTPKAILYSGLVSLAVYAVVPFSLLGVLGLSTISQDPYVALVTAAQMIFGTGGSWIVAIMLIAALLLSANTALYGSSRTLYQMAIDGTNIKQFGKLNKHNEPSVAIIFSIVLNIGLMFIGTPIFILVASSVGYLSIVPFVLFSYYYSRKKDPNRPRGFKIPDFFKYVALILMAWNVLIVVAGSYFYGLANFLVGFVIFMSAIPLYYYRMKVQNKKSTLISDNLNL